MSSSIITASSQQRGGDTSLSFVGNEPAMRLIGEFVSLETPILNIRMEPAMRLGRHRWITDDEMFTPDVMDNSPFYRDFLRPRGYGGLPGPSFPSRASARCASASRNASTTGR